MKLQYEEMIGELKKKLDDSKAEIADKNLAMAKLNEDTDSAKELMQKLLTEKEQLISKTVSLEEQLNIRRGQEEILQKFANTDFLTELPNRSMLASKARDLDAKHIPYYVAVIDLDNFKSVNDLHGHQEGDRLLKSVAGVLSDLTRASDIVARLGGDEFAVLFIDCSVENASNMLQQFIDLLPKASELAGKYQVSASVGLCASLSENFEIKLKLADFAMYTAKEQGRGRLNISPVTGTE